MIIIEDTLAVVGNSTSSRGAGAWQGAASPAAGLLAPIQRERCIECAGLSDSSTNYVITFICLLTTVKTCV